MVNVRAQLGRAHSGFALLDAILGAVVLGVAMSAMLVLTGQAVSSQARGERLTVASALADERLNMVLATGTDGYASVFELNGRCDAPFGEYSFEVEIDPGRETDADFVRVEVSWKEGARSNNIFVETFIARRLGDDPDPDRQPDQIVERQQ